MTQFHAVKCDQCGQEMTQQYNWKTETYLIPDNWMTIQYAIPSGDPTASVYPTIYTRDFCSLFCRDEWEKNHRKVTR
jgi:hypothetical protein